VEAVEEAGTIEEFQTYLGIHFDDPSLLLMAMTHSSAKSPEFPCNERLEFLGDSILGMVVAEVLYQTNPDFTEGDLTVVKSEVVSARTLAHVGREKGFDRFIRVGKGLQQRRSLPSSLIGGMVEALIGAIYLDRGLETARKFVLDCLTIPIRDVMANRHRKNFKSILQNHSQKVFGITPMYKVVGEKGPDHGKIFEVEARVGKQRFPIGRGRSKKEAEQVAAEYAMAVLSDHGKPCLPILLSDSALPLPWGYPENEGAEPEYGEEGTVPRVPAQNDGGESST
jgi:ribonuclease-3